MPPLAGASVNCNGRVFIKRSDASERPAVGWSAWLGAFGDAFNMSENSLMNAMNDVIRNRPPIPLRRNGMGVPRSAMQDGARTMLRNAKLAVMRNHVVLQMWRVEIATR